MTSYPPELDSRLFSKKGIAEGNEVRLHLSGGKAEEGFLMPRISAGDRTKVILKLKTGYNLSVSSEDITEAEKISEGIQVGKIIPLNLGKAMEGLPKIGLVATGGTIGTHVDYFTGGVFMCRTPEEVISTVPEIAKVVDITMVSSPFTAASEDMDFSHFSILAKEVGRILNGGAEGAIVTHGTDILHYTSAALSFALGGLTKPVCLVGAQRSPDRGSFDGSMNLLSAAHFIASRASAGVFLVMHGTTNDDYCLAHWGTKVRKMHTSRRDAFQSINQRPVAKIEYPSGKIESLSKDDARKVDLSGKVEVKEKFEDKVALVKVAPNLSPEVIDFYVSKRYKGLVIEGTGLGHVISNGAKSWLPSIKKAVDSGAVVVSTSQAIFGSTNPYVYRNLRLLGDAGAVFAKDTLPETAYVKLAWLLGQGNSAAEAGRLMRENLVGEINERISEKEFL